MIPNPGIAHAAVGPDAQPSAKNGIPSGGFGPKFRTVTIRVLDIIFSLVGLAVAAPLFPVVAALIKLESKGPVFFPAKRVGKDMKLFDMYKFRSMLESSTKIDLSICPQYDPRVTSVGRFLRRTKLNELPQLWNVLRGDMSFVGPRPEAPDLAEMYPEDAKKVFSAKPGLVGPAVISDLKGTTSGRNEEELYPKGVDPKKYYLEHIVPEKVKIDLYYLSRQTVLGYFQVIFCAAKETVFGALSSRHIDQGKRRILLFTADLALILVSYVLAFRVYVGTASAGASATGFFGGLLLVMAVRFLCQYGLGLYNLVIDLITLHDVHSVFKAVGLGGLLLMGISAVPGMPPYPLLLAAVDFALLSLLLAGVRLILMARYRIRDKLLAADRRPRVLIFGANRNGLAALTALGGPKNSPYNILGFIDPSEAKFGKKISGLKVLGNRYHLRALAILHNVRELIVVPDDKIRDQLGEISALCARAGIRCRIFPDEAENEMPGRFLYPVRSLRVSDIIPRVHVVLDLAALRVLLTDRTVLMLGSGGELGSTLCRNVLGSGCRRLVIVDRYESHLSEILSELKRDMPGADIVPVLMDDGNLDVLNKVFARHRPQIVIHSGMRKFITLQAADDEEVARSNYFRTFNLARLASSHGCEYFLLISSIRAASRGNFVSESLRVAEISLNTFFSGTPTRLIVTRIGNIIENRGGVVSWLNNRILEQSLLRLPSEIAKTFLLSKRDAARAILQSLVMASSISPGGSLLTAEPGVCLGLADVAGMVASLYGLKVGADIAIKFNEIPNGLLDEEPADVLAASENSGRLLETGFGCEEGQRLIENMISSDVRFRSEEDWYRRTHEIMCLFSSSRAIKKDDRLVH